MPSDISLIHKAIYTINLLFKYSLCGLNNFYYGPIAVGISVVLEILC